MPPMRIPKLFAALMAAGLLAGGCYEYVPVPPAMPIAGQFVRTGISEQAASRLTSVLGPGVTQVHGMVLRQEPEAISILVDTYVTARSGELNAGNEPVLLQYPEIRDLSLKQISKKKSVLFGAAFIGGAVLTAAVFTDLGRVFSGQDGDGNPQPEMRAGSRLGAPIGIRIPIGVR